MPEMKVLVRAATLSYDNNGQPGRKHPRDLVEFTHGVVSIYFINPPNRFSRYERVDVNLGEYGRRLDKAGARALHLTPEESEEVRKVIFETTDEDEISKFIATMNRRIEKLGLKADETNREKGMRKSLR